MKVATLDDFQELVDMGLSFLSTTDYIDYTDKTTVENLILTLLSGKQNEMIILLEPGAGMLLGTATPFIFGTQIIASEIGWWVVPEKRKSGVGKDLVEAFEYWAKNIAGCSMITLTSLDDKVGKFYEKKGYKLHERAYMKTL